MKKHYRHDNDCLNCGTILEGKFCHNCGQENLEMKESFGHMLNHAISDYFHFDDQFFSTLKPLFFSPGKLTVEYLAGRRAHYLHPVKMYIFVSLVFFVLFFWQNGNNLLKVKNGKENTRIADTIKNAINKDVSRDTTLTPAQKAIIAKNVNKFISDDEDLKSKKIAATPANRQEYKGFSPITIIDDNKDPKTYDDYLAAQQKLPPVKRDDRINRYIKKKSYDWKSHGENGQEIFIEALKHNSPKMMFILLPLFALLLSIAFWKNKKYYVEHMIYAIHLHSFVFLFLLVNILLDMIIPASWQILVDWINFAVFMAICYYVYRSLRVVYNRSRWRTISKMIGVSLMYSLAFGICFMLIVVITAITTV